MKLMSNVINKIFRLDDFPFEDEVLAPFNKLYEKKKSKIIDFYRELIDIPELEVLTIDKIFDE
jgi:hypothetical protein